MNKKNLSEKLTKFHAMALYDFMCPLDYTEPIDAEMILNREKDAIRRYQSEPVFYARVNSLVAGTLHLIETENNKDIIGEL
ncbi:MAG: hypothetical protein SVW57_13200 [Thermodesulfobacteriota bacterium]|nr:hypothetical protein [Thermodesulfobacteriota bacterium]